MGSEPALREELLAMAAADRALRVRLVAEGTLFDGYHPEIAALHHRHATRLAGIVASRGWPGRTLVGDDGAEAAWLVVQHTIGDPPLMRRCLPLLEAAGERGEVPACQPAYLLDRVRTLEGRPQRYGTQHDWDAGGELSPQPLEDPARVDARRAAVGLGRWWSVPRGCEPGRRPKASGRPPTLTRGSGRSRPGPATSAGRMGR